MNRGIEWSLGAFASTSSDQICLVNSDHFSHTAGSNGWAELLTDKLRGKNVSTSLFQSNHNWFIQLQSRIHEISSNRVHLRIWACKQLWKFCKQKQVSCHQIFASNLSWGQILQALLNRTIWYPYETMLNMSCGGVGGGGGRCEDAGNSTQLLQLYWGCFPFNQAFWNFWKRGKGTEILLLSSLKIQKLFNFQMRTIQQKNLEIQEEKSNGTEITDKHLSMHHKIVFFLRYSRKWCPIDHGKFPPSLV